MIRAQKISKRYQQGSMSITALEEVSFDIPSGQTLAIIGPSGSGKTTLLSIMAGLEQPSSGTVYINDTALSMLDEKALSQFRAQQIGIVFQQFHLMPHLSALENVCLALELLGQANTLERARSALAAVGLEHRQNHLPSQLSGGERQRTAIARAMVVEPSLLFADEPSGNLDAKTGSAVMDLLFQLTEDQHKTLVLVTHNTELAAQCNRVFQLEGGRIVE